MSNQAASKGDYLKIRNLRQLTTIDIDLSKQVTLIAGANGSGKTTILRILGQLVGWQAGAKPGTSHGTVEGSLLGGQVLPEAQLTTPLVRIFENGLESSQEPIAGIFVPAQRAGYVPGALSNIPVGWEGARSLLEQYQSDEQHRGGQLQMKPPMAPNLALKAGLVVSALNGFVTGPGVEPNDEARALFETYTETLRSLLPQALGFKRIIVRSPEVYLEIADGEVPLDNVSGGTASMMDLAWQITLATRANPSQPFVVLIDELENHLHPAAQRTALPALVKAFPNAKFIVATHSPHVFASIEDATHVVLKRANVGFVSETVDMPASLLTPDEVLRESLGLDVTMPVWVEEKLEEITNRHQDTLVGDRGFESLRDDLEAAGLGRLLPSATARILESQP
jgi:energy-coupling factor transporter ATP-binding protein EcfA2